METARQSSKDETILPKTAGDRHRRGPSADFAVENIAGCLKSQGKSLTLDAMDAAIDADVQVRRDRGRS